MVYYYNRARGAAMCNACACTGGKDMYRIINTYNDDGTLLCTEKIQLHTAKYFAVDLYTFSVVYREICAEEYFSALKTPKTVLATQDVLSAATATAKHFDGEVIVHFADGTKKMVVQQTAAQDLLMKNLRAAAAKTAAAQTKEVRRRQSEKAAQAAFDDLMALVD
jgi:hypothetical protein